MSVINCIDFPSLLILEWMLSINVLFTTSFQAGFTILQDKFLQKVHFSRHGIPLPEFMEVAFCFLFYRGLFFCIEIH